MRAIADMARSYRMNRLFGPGRNFLLARRAGGNAGVIGALWNWLRHRPMFASKLAPTTTG